MKVIDLLNKIANGEEVPKKIKLKGAEPIYQYENKEFYYYWKDKKTGKGGKVVLDVIYNINDEVEVIEDNNKIEHIGKKYDITDFKREYPKVAELVKDLNNKQYEIIDKLNEVLNEKN